MNNLRFLSAVLIATILVSPFKTQAISLEPEIQYAEGQVLVKFKESRVDVSDSRSLSSIDNFEPKEIFEEQNIVLMETDGSQSVKQMIQELEKNPLVEYAEPNYKRTVSMVPNDSLLNLQWALNNTGQTVNTVVGTADADIDALEAFDTLNQSPDVIVAVLDTGIRKTHEDLTLNMWDGSVECFSDLNVLIDGGCPNHGYTFTTGYPDPLDTNDDHGHGTFIAGQIGADTNNNLGIAGISSDVQIMSVKFMNENGDGFVSDEIKAINFAKNNGAMIINASFGGAGGSQAELEAIQSFPGLFVAAAGNEENDNDLNPTYPADYNLPNIISVASSNSNDALSDFTNFGDNSVELAAPGEDIISTSYTSDSSYAIGSGTSFAAPYVVGAAALLLGQDPTYTVEELKYILTYTGDTIQSFIPKIASGKRLNLNNALTLDLNPRIGYEVDGTIPDTQITQGENGIITVNFRLKDEIDRTKVTLQGFQYSTDGGGNYISPTNGDDSEAFSENWTDNNYLTAIDFNGDVYSFSFDITHPDFSGFVGNDLDEVKILFFVSNPLGSTGSVMSENFSVDLLAPEPVTLSEVSNTTSRSATITVTGTEDVTHYIYKLNSGSYSGEFPISTPISLSGLSTGMQIVSVLGRDAAGNFQLEPSIESWTISSSGGGGGGGGGGGSSSTTTKTAPKVEVPIETEKQTETPEFEQGDIIRSVFTFSDINSHWAKDFISKLATLGIVSGKTPSTFAPDDLLSRAEMLKIALKSFNLDSFESTIQNPFSDVYVLSDWFGKLVLIGVEQKIVSGFPDGTFRPNAPITRAEALKILLEASDLDLTTSTKAPFADVLQSAWYAKYVNFAYNKGIVGGKSPGQFAPNDFITRAEMAKIAVKVTDLR